MNRQEIQQHIYDTLGVILIDKTEIREDATLQELVMDESDMLEFFMHLQSDHGIILSPQFKSQVAQPTRRLTVHELVDLISRQLRGRKPH